MFGMQEAKGRRVKTIWTRVQDRGLEALSLVVDMDLRPMGSSIVVAGGCCDRNTTGHLGGISVLGIGLGSRGGRIVCTRSHTVAGI